jgi:hypothetical protein
VKSRIFNRLFWKPRDSIRLIIASIGTGIGLFVMLVSLQFAAQINSMFNYSRAKGEALYLVLSKQVKLIGNTLENKSASFSDDEIGDLAQRDFTLDMDRVLTNEFPLIAAVDTSGGVISTEMFFESVPDRFLDFELDKWNWDESSQIVPVAVSREFLALYNFGYAPSRGMPQLTEGTIGVVPIAARIGSYPNTRDLQLRVVAFSDRYSSILVPYNFLEWANTNFGDSETITSRLIVKADPKAEKIINEYLNFRGIQTNKDRLKIGSVASTLFSATLIISVFGIAIVIMAVLLLGVTIQAALNQNRDRLILLMQLGYNRRQLIKSIAPGILTILTSSLLFFNIGGVILNNFLQDLIGTYVSGVGTGIALPVVVLLLLSVLGLPALVLALLRSELVRVES